MVAWDLWRRSLEKPDSAQGKPTEYVDAKTTPQETAPRPRTDAEYLAETDQVEKDEPAPTTQKTVSSPPTEPESVATKDERFNLWIIWIIAPLVFQIFRATNITSLIADPVAFAYGEGPSLMVAGLIGGIAATLPAFLLWKFGKKQSSKFYAVAILACFGVFTVQPIFPQFTSDWIMGDPLPLKSYLSFFLLLVFLSVLMAKAGVVASLRQARETPRGLPVLPVRDPREPEKPPSKPVSSLTPQNAKRTAPEIGETKVVMHETASVGSCAECGFANSAEMKFCTKCGSELSHGCDGCGFENPQGSAFCGQCGNALRAVEDVLQETPPPEFFPPPVTLDDLSTEPERWERWQIAKAIIASTLVGDYKLGLKHGKWESYHENGQLATRETFRYGQWHGPVEWYYENGQVREKRTYKKDGLHGPLSCYEENGRLTVKGVFRRDKKCGEWVENGVTVTYDPCPPDLEDGN